VERVQAYRQFEIARARYEQALREVRARSGVEAWERLLRCVRNLRCAAAAIEDAAEAQGLRAWTSRAS
jgi:hypothetical protein